MVFDPRTWRGVAERDQELVDQREPEEWLPEKIDRYEATIGFVLPAGYRWLLETHPGLVLAPRWLQRGGRDSPVRNCVHLWGPIVIDWYFDNALAGPEFAPELRAWEQQLYRCLVGSATESGSSVIALDFMFDSVQPPLVEVDIGGSWEIDIENAAGRWGNTLAPTHGKVSFVADSFDAFFEAPPIIDDKPVGQALEPSRELEWAEWRNARLVTWRGQPFEFGAT